MKDVKKISGYLVPNDEQDAAISLAELFCNMNSKYQAEFFNRIFKIDKEEWKGKGIFQWSMMEKDLTSGGLNIIQDMYEHTKEVTE